MSATPSRLLVALAHPVVFLKISGRATFVNSVHFKQVLHRLCAQGYCEYVLDVTDCLIMDSTFLGILAGFSLKVVQAPKAHGKSWIRLLNPNSRLTELLDNMGITHLFQVSNGVPPLAQYNEPAVSTPNPIEVARTSLEAHETLMTVNPANIPKFKEVAQFLAEDLQRLKEENKALGENGQRPEDENQAGK